MGTASTLIGIKLWLAPQISEHWPKNTPVRLNDSINWFNRPGRASAFTPNEGRAHEWITSDLVAINRTWLLIGIIILLSVSNRRLIWYGEVKGNIYESKDRSGKSEYSYDQNHWCPVVLIVRSGVNGSSRRYKACSEGRAIVSRIITG